jgi:MFS family permease
VPWSRFDRYLAPAARVARLADDAVLGGESHIAAGLAAAFPPSEGWSVRVRPIELEAVQVRIRRGFGEGVDVVMGPPISEEPAPEAGRRWLGVEAMAASRACAFPVPLWFGPLVLVVLAAMAVFGRGGRHDHIPGPFGWMADLPQIAMLGVLFVLGILLAAGVCVLLELATTRGRGNYLRRTEELRLAGEAAAVAAGADPT